MSVGEISVSDGLDTNGAGVSDTRFSVFSAPDGREAVVQADGEVGVATAARFRGALRYAMVCRPHRLVVDMTRVSAIDSTGLSILVAVDTRCKDLDIQMMLMAPSARTLRLLKATRLDQVLMVMAGT